MDDLGGRPLTRWRGAGGLGRPRNLVVPAVVALLQLCAAYGAGHHHQPAMQLAPAEWVLLVVGPLALVFRRRFPVAVMWVTFLATLGPSGSRFAYLSLIVSYFVAATGGHRRAGWAMIAVGYVSSLWIAPLVWGDATARLDVALVLGAWLAVLVAAAEATRLRQERTVEARAARQAAMRQVASEERLRMARDLHDVIGHNISLINVQAGVGLDLMDDQPEQARAALAAIRAVSKEALDELRTMLAALRQDGEDAPRAPAPGVNRLPELVELTRAAGLSVILQVTGQPRPLPAAVDLAAYRIVQESLTNVARHAGPATATVELAYESDRLIVAVTDDGRRPSPVGASGRDGGGSALGAGSGIVGMRERASSLGGRLTAEPRPGGGFQVSASLPYGSSS